MKTLQVICAVILSFSSSVRTIEYLTDEELTQYLQPDDVGRNREYDNLNHTNPTLCTRNCEKFSDPRLCYYQFNVEEYSAMGPACGNCTKGNKTDCHRRQCIEADGIERAVISVNRQIPGPSIVVCSGDRIVVDVINKMATSSVTVHWHGVLQKDTPWMDGVPYVTQCPILPNNKFRYDFPALTNGTLFYHAHMAHLHSNGLYGALIVHPPLQNDLNQKEQDYDLPSHTVHISDWTHLPAEVYAPGYFQDPAHIPTKPDVFLINGRGSYGVSNNRTNANIAEFHLQCGPRYRFRVIGSMTSTCSVRFAVEGHSLRVVAVDGYPCRATNVSTLVMSAGQRTDVILMRNESEWKCTDKKKSFFMVVKGMDGCEDMDQQVAHVIYDNAPKPQTMPDDLIKVYNKTRFLNNHVLGCFDERINVCADTLPPVKGLVNSMSPSPIANHTFIIRPQPYRLNISEVFENNTYDYFYVPFGPNGTYAATLNNVSGLLPPVPLLTQENEIPATGVPICRESHAGCPDHAPFCRCIHILEVGLNSYVEVQFEGVSQRVHPIHLHGHHFWVINPISIFDVLIPEQIQRDTMHAPLNNMSRLQFHADNPGYWIMHCHFSHHLDGGMFLIFKVGESSDFKPVPKGFPKCGNFLPPIEKPKYNSLV